MINKSYPGFIHVPEFEIAQQIIDQMTKADIKSFFRIKNKLNVAIEGWNGVDIIMLLNEMEYRLKLVQIREEAFTAN